MLEMFKAKPGDGPAKAKKSDAEDGAK